MNIGRYESAIDRALAFVAESASLRGEVPTTTVTGMVCVEQHLHRSHELVFQKACDLLANYFEDMGFYDAYEEGHGEGADDLAHARDGAEEEWEEEGIRQVIAGGDIPH